MIGPGGLKIGIQVGIRTRVFNCVVSECLMKTFSIEDTFTPCQRVHKILDFSDTILRKSLDFLDQFLLNNIGGTQSLFPQSGGRLFDAGTYPFSGLR
ncbi:MAG: hypothetical protein H0W34_00840 [Pyrinomonadaceae bacterium]|nr:hypothetical protein [Pyrinomonadaceae bacterium]